MTMGSMLSMGFHGCHSAWLTMLMVACTMQNMGHAKHGAWLTQCNTKWQMRLDTYGKVTKL